MSDVRIPGENDKTRADSRQDRQAVEGQDLRSLRGCQVQVAQRDGMAAGLRAANMRLRELLADLLGRIARQQCLVPGIHPGYRAEHRASRRRRSQPPNPRPVPPLTADRGMTAWALSWLPWQASLAFKDFGGFNSGASCESVCVWLPGVAGAL